MIGNVSCSEIKKRASYLYFPFHWLHLFSSVTLTTWVDTSKSSEPAKVTTSDFLIFAQMGYSLNVWRTASPLTSWRSSWTCWRQTSPRSRASSRRWWQSARWVTRKVLVEQRFLLRPRTTAEGNPKWTWTFAGWPCFPWRRWGSWARWLR